MIDPFRVPPRGSPFVPLPGGGFIGQQIELARHNVAASLAAGILSAAGVPVSVDQAVAVFREVLGKVYPAG